LTYVRNVHRMAPLDGTQTGSRTAGRAIPAAL
jgi:hypothetical protein